MKIKREKENIGKLRPKAQKSAKNHQISPKISPKKRKKIGKREKKDKKGKKRCAPKEK